MMMDRTSAQELYELSRVVPAKFVQQAPRGKFGSYVPHYVIVQWLLATVGPYDWELVEVLRGDSSGVVKKKDVAFEGVIVGCVYRLTCTIDGRSVRIEEVGEVDAYLHSGDGARLKHATSSALKRCAMRLGVAIQLWCKEPSDHFLPEYLNRRTPVEGDEEETGEVAVVGGEEQDEPTYHTGGVIKEPKPFKVPPHIPARIDDFTAVASSDMLIDQLKPMPETTSKDPTPRVVIKPPPDTWNQLLATLENLPAVTDTKPVWLKYAKQLTGLMILAGLWHETEGGKLTELSKKALVEKVTVAHKQATKKAGERAPF